jgi:3-deoxy-D-manno-octulosonic-acid transferase
MSYIYNIGIYLYQVIIYLASFFDSKAKLWVVGRKNWKTKLQQATEGADKIFWFHAASLGEFEQGRPLIESIKKEQKDIFILLTFFSPSGYEIRKDYEGADYICYLPSDTKANAQDFISIVKPQKAFFIKYEFWYNYLSELKKQKADLYLISGVFREDHVFFKPYGGWFLKQLKNFDKFYLQDQSSVNLLKLVGFNNMKLTGDTRFDRVIEIAENTQEIEKVKIFVDNKPCVVVGSSWPIEEEMLAEYINQHPENKYIIAPHEINESHIKEIEDRINQNTIRWSNLKDEKEGVLIIDNIGMLSKLYKHADVAYVGGAFGSGLHNILEAAVYGIPVVFGPKISRNQEALDLIERNGAFSVSNKSELFQELEMLFSDKMKLKLMGENSKSFIYQSKGASQKVLSDIF